MTGRESSKAAGGPAQELAGAEDDCDHEIEQIPTQH